MKTTKQLSLTLALLVLASYSMFTTMRVRQLEARLSKVEFAQHASTPISYAFDDSFIQYFGQKGIDAVDKVMRRGASDPGEILNEAAREVKSQ